MIHATHLNARVHGRNKANRLAIELYKELSNFFASLVGCKILKADGSLLKKHDEAVKQLLGKYKNYERVSVYRSNSTYSLVWVVKVWDMYQRTYSERANYEETTVYVGELNGDVLTKLSNAPQYRFDYSADEIREKREKYKALAKLADDAKSELFPFDEYDR